jgi:hypothetical protein
VPSGRLRNVCFKVRAGKADTVSMDIGEPDTEREIEVTPLEEPVPTPAPAEEPAREPAPA